jgi:hypothetical protein
MSDDRASVRPVPGSLEAAIVFSLLIVPGYQLVRGYAVARGADAPDKDLYVLAQAIVASLGWLAFTWIVVEDLLRWVDGDEVSDHLLESYLIVPLVVGLPYFAGRLAGLLVVAVMRPDNPRGPDWFPWVLRALGLASRDTTWDRVWLRVKRQGRGVVTVSLDNGSSIVGQFAGDSEVATSPAEPAVFFERAYEIGEDGALLTYEGGVHVDAARIVALKLNRIGGA